MKSKTDTGVFQVEDGGWCYRYSILVDGQRLTKRKTVDEFGNKLKAKRDAVKAREAAIQKAILDRQRKKEISRRTFSEVYKEYCERGRMDRAYQTIRKQDSLWNNHLQKRFGNRFVDDISVAEVVDYLSELYFQEGYSYQYTESFLKMFYLIFGQAYSRDYLDVDTYNKLCVNKDTRIRMPKQKSEDDTDIVSFSTEELRLLDDYFRGTNAETAYLLGRYCGLRINECFGLKWDHVDLEAGTIFIDRQMQYQDGLIKLVAPKTRNSKRLMYMNEPLKVHFQELYLKTIEAERDMKELRKQRQRMIDDIDGKKIPSTDLVNCLLDGKLQTVNSMKYPSREIKKMFGIDFKFHHLRHTYGTRMAEMNTPAHLLCNQMGHGNIHVTQRYYLSVSQTGVEVLQKNLNKL